MHRKFKQLTQGHKASEWWGTNWNPSEISELSSISDLIPNSFTKYVSLIRFPFSFVTKPLPYIPAYCSCLPPGSNTLTLSLTNCILW